MYRVDRVTVDEQGGFDWRAQVTGGHIFWKTECDCCCDCREGFQDTVKSRMFSREPNGWTWVAFRDSGPLMVGILLCAGLHAFKGTS